MRSIFWCTDIFTRAVRAAAAGPVPRAAAAGPVPRADAPPHTTHALLLPPDRAGFRHSAFTFGCEAMVAKSNISGAKIPPGQLVNFIQKGIMYAELERSIAADGTDHPSTEPFSLLQSPAAEKRGGKGASGGASSSEPVAMDTDGGGGELTPEEQVTTLAGHDGEVFICAWSPTSLQLASGSGDSTARIWAVPSGACGKAQTKAMAAPSVLQHVGADKEKVKDVTTLDWSPDGASLATGAYDGQARIWSGAAGKLLRTLTKHKGPIFSIKWNRTGARRPHARRRTRRRPPTTRARARVSLPQASTCSRGRSTRRRLCGTPRPAPSSSSSPSTISRRSTFAARHTRPAHAAGPRSSRAAPPSRRWTGATRRRSRRVRPTRWCTCARWGRTRTSSASRATRTRRARRACPRDGRPAPSERRAPTQVNAIKWDPSGTLLASCSDDYTAKIWSLAREGPVHDLRKHTKEVYTIKWAPTGAGSANPGSPPLLASASFDTTIRLWDPESGRCCHVLDKHREPVYSVAFSADGLHLASGSLDNCLHIWSARVRRCR